MLKVFAQWLSAAQRQSHDSDAGAVLWKAYVYKTAKGYKSIWTEHIGTYTKAYLDIYKSIRTLPTKTVKLLPITRVIIPTKSI